MEARPESPRLKMLSVEEWLLDYVNKIKQGDRERIVQKDIKTVPDTNSEISIGYRCSRRRADTTAFPST